MVVGVAAFGAGRWLVVGVAAFGAGRWLVGGGCPWRRWLPVAPVGRWWWVGGTRHRRRLFVGNSNLHDFNYTRPAAQRLRGADATGLTFFFF